MLPARSRHASVRSLKRYARPGVDAVARHVTAQEPAAPLDLTAWCHLTGHTYLCPVDRAAGSDIYGLRLATSPRPTRPDSPWHPV